MRTIRPVGDTIVVYPFAERELGGERIVAPESAQTNPERWGQIVALGPKYTGEIKVGMKVLFEAFSGMEKEFLIGDDGEQHKIRIVREGEIIAFLEE